MANLCNKLEPSPSGHLIQDKQTGEKFYSLVDLINSQGCLDCVQRYNCKLIQILECNYKI